MTPLKQINDEIYRRWKAGENHIDLANEHGRSPSRVETLVRHRHYAENASPPGPSPQALHEAVAPRNRQLIAARETGLSWRKLGEQFSLSPERCRQIYARHLRTNPSISE